MNTVFLNCLTCHILHKTYDICSTWHRYLSEATSSDVSATMRRDVNEHVILNSATAQTVNNTGDRRAADDVLRQCALPGDAESKRADLLDVP